MGCGRGSLVRAPPCRPIRNAVVRCFLVSSSAAEALVGLVARDHRSRQRDREGRVESAALGRDARARASSLLARTALSVSVRLRRRASEGEVVDPAALCDATRAVRGCACCRSRVSSASVVCPKFATPPPSDGRAVPVALSAVTLLLAMRLLRDGRGAADPESALGGDRRAARRSGDARADVILVDGAVCEEERAVVLDSAGEGEDDRRRCCWRSRCCRARSCA